MRLRTTIVLLVLFFAGLAALWWADHADIKTAAQRRLLTGLLLPEFADTQPRDVRRLEIVRKGESGRFVVERRDEGGWQIREPMDAAADPTLVETLILNLREMHTSADSGTILGDPATFGLDAPLATLSLYGKDAARPLAALEVGKSVRERVYVRPKGAKGIEVVDQRLIGALNQEPVGWRDRMLFHIPSSRVSGVTVDEPRQKRVVELARDERRWRMLRPVKTSADEDKTEGLIAEISALRVADGPDGFAANDVSDLAPYGLDHPLMTLTLTPYVQAGTPQILKLGDPVPGRADQVYALRGDQNDVVRVDVKTLRPAYQSPEFLRSPKVADFLASRVDRVIIDTPERVFDLARSGQGWELLRPSKNEADRASVQRLLADLGELKTSEFLDPAAVVDARLEPPRYRLRLWQSSPGSASSSPDASESREPRGELRVDLKLGRHDLVRKVVYAKIEGDRSVLALPDTILRVLPRNAFAFRDLSVVSFGPAQVRKLSVERGGKTVTIQAPGSNTAALRWRMVEPVNAPANETAVTNLVMTLSDLRAESWESESVGDGRAFGLDAPWLRVRWTLESGARPGGPAPVTVSAPKTLRVGRLRSNDGFFANIEGDPSVFLLKPQTVAIFEAELHDPIVLKFSAAEAEKVVFRWPTRTLSLANASPKDRGEASTWQVEPGYDPSGFNQGLVGPLVKAMGELRTLRFVQYEGPIPPPAGLEPPRVTVQVFARGTKAPITLRIGNQGGPKSVVATTAAGDAGPVFLLPTSESWDELIRTPPQAGGLPNDVFSPGAPASRPRSGLAGERLFP